MSNSNNQAKQDNPVKVAIANYLQSRGVCNQTTEQHSQILKLVNENINLIKQAA